MKIRNFDLTEDNSNMLVRFLKLTNSESGKTVVNKKKRLQIKQKVFFKRFASHPIWDQIFIKILISLC